jgi:hypothetical protein
MRNLTCGERETLKELNRDAGPPDWRELRSATQTARKEHTCSACGRPIMRGARYELIVGTEDGQFCQERYHRACVGGPWD